MWLVFEKINAVEPEVDYSCVAFLLFQVDPDPLGSEYVICF